VKIPNVSEGVLQITFEAFASERFNVQASKGLEVFEGFSSKGILRLLKFFFKRNSSTQTKLSLAMISSSSLFVESLLRCSKQFVLSLLSCLSSSVAFHHVPPKKFVPAPEFFSDRCGICSLALANNKTGICYAEDPPDGAKLIPLVVSGSPLLRASGD
jgi:hypothetical protein